MSETILRAHGADDLTVTEISRCGGYRRMLAHPSFCDKIEDQLDDLVNRRSIAVRNALRELGWDGPVYGTLAKNGQAACLSFEKSSSGNNNRGYSINSQPDFFEETDAEFAALIDKKACGEAAGKPASKPASKPELPEEAAGEAAGAVVEEDATDEAADEAVDEGFCAIQAPRDGRRFTGAMSGVFDLGEMQKTLFPGLCGGELLSYLLRRFGPSTSGWDDHKELTCYRLTTPDPQVRLIVRPCVGTSRIPMSFGYLLEEDLSRAVRAESDAPHHARVRAAGLWYHENFSHELHPELQEAFTINSEGPAKFWYEMPELMMEALDMDDGAHVELFDIWNKALRLYPVEITESEPGPLWQKCFLALAAAMRDLLRPVFVRDRPINALGVIRDRDCQALEDCYGRSVSHSAAAGYGVPELFINDPEAFYESFAAPAVKTVKTCQFSVLALGGRFCYPGSPRVFVKLGCDRVADWDTEQICSGWTAQTVCSASEDDNQDFLVEVVG